MWRLTNYLFIPIDLLLTQNYYFTLNLIFTCQLRPQNWTFTYLLSNNKPLKHFSDPNFHTDSPIPITLIGQPSSQSSTYDSSISTADKVVDGNTDGNYYTGQSCAVTSKLSPTKFNLFFQIIKWPSLWWVDILVVHMYILSNLIPKKKTRKGWNNEVNI